MRNECPKLPGIFPHGTNTKSACPLEVIEADVAESGAHNGTGVVTAYAAHEPEAHGVTEVFAVKAGHVEPVTPSQNAHGFRPLAGTKHKA